MHEQIRTHGYAIVESVLREPECDALLDELAKIGRSRAGARHVLSRPNVAALARDPRLLAIARGAFGVEPVAFRATLFDKSAGADWSVVWHQDTALPLRTMFAAPGWGPWSSKAGVLYAHAPTEALQRVLALRVHLDDSLATNGPLRVLPRTHLRGVLTDEEVAHIADLSPHVDCVVRRGGVVAMRPLLIHSSPRLQIAAPRRVLHIEYADALVLEPGVELAIA